MQVPASIGALWMQRKRWARGQGEVLHVHFDEVCRWRNRRMWFLGFEGVASLLWVGALALALVIAVLGMVADLGDNVFGFALGWGVAIALVATVQTIVALTLEQPYDRSIFRPLVLGVLYPLAYWIISGLAAIHSEVGSLLRGPSERRVVWNIPRQPLAEHRETPRE
jgi:biofilm PGA synthesis N-glycosyltransferase PgaC